jgi:hypothetical protein
MQGTAYSVQRSAFSEVDAWLEEPGGDLWITPKAGEAE